MAMARYDSEDQILLEADSKLTAAEDDKEEIKKESNENFNVSIEIQENAGGEGENPTGFTDLSTNLSARMAKARKNRNRNRKRRNKNRTAGENYDADAGRESDISNDFEAELTSAVEINISLTPEIQPEKSSNSYKSLFELVEVENPIDSEAVVINNEVKELKTTETDAIVTNTSVSSCLIPEEALSNSRSYLVEPEPFEFEGVPSNDDTTEPESVVSIRTLLDRAKEISHNDPYNPPMEKTSLKILYLAEEVTLCEQSGNSEPAETETKVDASSILPSPPKVETESMEYLDKEWDVNANEEDRLNNNYWPPDSKSKLNLSTSINLVSKQLSAVEDLILTSNSELHLTVPNPSREDVDERNCQPKHGENTDDTDCYDVDFADYRGYCSHSVAHRSLFRSEHPDLISPFVTTLDNILQLACEKVECLGNNADIRDDGVIQYTQTEEESFVGNQVSDSLHNLLEVEDGEYSKVYPQDPTLPEDVENKTQNSFTVNGTDECDLCLGGPQFTLSQVKEFFGESSPEDCDWHSACSEYNHTEVELRSPVSEGPSEYYDAHSLASHATSASTIKEENDSLTSEGQNTPPSVIQSIPRPIEVEVEIVKSNLESFSKNNIDAGDFLLEDEEPSADNNFGMRRSSCLDDLCNIADVNSCIDQCSNIVEIIAAKTEDSVTVIPLHRSDSPFTSQSQVSDSNSGGFHIASSSKVEITTSIEVGSSTKVNKSKEFGSKHIIDPLVGVNKTRRRFMAKNEVSYPSPTDIWKVNENTIVKALATSQSETKEEETKEEKKWYSWMFPCVPKKKDRRARSVSNESPEKPRARNKRDFSLPRRFSRTPKSPSTAEI